MAFGYFEALIHHGDSNRFGVEEARLRSLTNVVVQAGFSQMVFDDFADETYTLLREIANAVNEGHDAVALLFEKFNDSTIQDYIISHLRVRTDCFDIGTPANDKVDSHCGMDEDT